MKGYFVNGQGLKERYHTDGKKLIIETVQDEKEIIEQNKRFRNDFDGYTPSRNMKHVATVPIIFIEKWVKESGLRLGTREFANYLAKKLNDPDNEAFRTGKGRIGTK